MQRWVLKANGRVVGTIDVTASDFPWLIGRFEPEAEFAEFKDAFAEELALVEGGDFDQNLARWEKLYLAIQDRLRLQGPDGVAVAEYVLHIDGERAWFRFSDQPFG